MKSQFASTVLPIAREVFRIDRLMFVPFMMFMHLKVCENDTNIETSDI